ncbi:hypothetical protein MNBD_GAMMA12-284, partial [hydrothermal vent metagenome]
AHNRRHSNLKLLHKQKHNKLVKNHKLRRPWSRHQRHSHVYNNVHQHTDNKHPQKHQHKLKHQNINKHQHRDHLRGFLGHKHLHGRHIGHHNHPG